jgi:hypothetical protein
VHGNKQEKLLMLRHESWTKAQYLKLLPSRLNTDQNQNMLAKIKTKMLFAGKFQAK